MNFFKLKNGIRVKLEQVLFVESNAQAISLFVGPGSDIRVTDEEDRRKLEAILERNQ